MGKQEIANGSGVGIRGSWGLDRQALSMADEISHDDANYWSISGKGPRDESATPVGSFGANGYGLFNVAGNVWE